MAITTIERKRLQALLTGRVGNQMWTIATFVEFIPLTAIFISKAVYIEVVTSDPYPKAPSLFTRAGLQYDVDPSSRRLLLRRKNWATMRDASGISYRLA